MAQNTIIFGYIETNDVKKFEMVISEFEFDERFPYFKSNFSRPLFSKKYGEYFYYTFINVNNLSFESWQDWKDHFISFLELIDFNLAKINLESIFEDKEELIEYIYEEGKIFVNLETIKKPDSFNRQSL